MIGARDRIPRVGSGDRGASDSFDTQNDGAAKAGGPRDVLPVAIARQDGSGEEISASRCPEPSGPSDGGYESNPGNRAETTRGGPSQPALPSAPASFVRVRRPLIDGAAPQMAAAAPTDAAASVRAPATEGATSPSARTASTAQAAEIQRNIAAKV